MKRLSHHEDSQYFSMQCDFLELCVHYMGTGLNKLVTKFHDNASKSSPNISCLMVALCRALKV